MTGGEEQQRFAVRAEELNPSGATTERNPGWFGVRSLALDAGK